MRSASGYRRSTLAIYHRSEVAAVNVQKGRISDVLDEVKRAQFNLRSLSKFGSRLDAIGSVATRESADLFTSMFRETGANTADYLASRASAVIGKDAILPKALLEEFRADFVRTKVGGKSLSTRLVQLAEDDLQKIRLRAGRWALQGEEAAVAAQQVKRIALGVDGKSGALYRARRLQRSELTRYNAHLTVHLSQYLEDKYGLLTVYTFHTQEDDRVRDAHETQQDAKFIGDEVAGVTAFAAVSEALSLLEDPNCRCWLDVQYLPT